MRLFSCLHYFSFSLINYLFVCANIIFLYLYTFAQFFFIFMFAFLFFFCMNFRWWHYFSLSWTSIFLKLTFIGINVFVYFCIFVLGVEILTFIHRPLKCMFTFFLLGATYILIPFQRLVTYRVSQNSLHAAMSCVSSLTLFHQFPASLCIVHTYVGLCLSSSCRSY